MGYMFLHYPSTHDEYLFLCYWYTRRVRNLSPDTQGFKFIFSSTSTTYATQSKQVPR